MLFTLVACGESLPPDAHPECDGVWVREVVGQVLDEAGEPVADADAQACLNTVDGRWLCLTPRSSDAEGRFVVELAEDKRCLERVAVRARATDRAIDYCVPELTEEQVDIGEVFVPATSGDWRVEGAQAIHPSGLVLESANEDDAMALVERTRAHSLEAGSQCQQRNLALSSSVGFTPEGFVRDVRLRVLPAPGLSEGQRAEIVLLGGLYGELASGEVLAEGEGLAIASGTVSGGVIETDVAIPFLTWLGVRPL